MEYDDVMNDNTDVQKSKIKLTLCFYANALWRYITSLTCYVLILIVISGCDGWWNKTE